MRYKVLHPEIARRLVEGIEDELTPLNEARAHKIQETPCLRCKGAMRPHIHAPHAFTPGDLLPRTVARCGDCGLIFDHVTGLVLDPGDPSKVEEALQTLRPTKD